MGGLVNRAAFKKIQPLFAKGETQGTPISRSAPADQQNSPPYQGGVPHRGGVVGI